MTGLNESKAIPLTNGRRSSGLTSQLLSEVKVLSVNIPLLGQLIKLRREILMQSQCIKALSRCFGLLSQALVDEQGLYHSLEIQIHLVEVLIDG